MLVGHTSPALPLRAADDPIVRSAAGAIGMPASAPPASADPIVPPEGAVPEIASGKSAGVNAVRWTLSA